MSTEAPDLPDVMSEAMMTDPYRGAELLREQAPVVRGRLMGAVPVWYVTRYEEVMTVLGDRRFVSNIASVSGSQGDDARTQMAERLGVPAEDYPYLANGMLGQDAPDHSRLRKLVMRVFTVRRITELRPRLEAITASLIDAFDDSGRVDLIAAFAYPLPLTVICELMGIPESDHADWHAWSSGLASLEPGVMPRALHDMVTGVRELVERRRDSPADDLLTTLIRTHDEDGDRLSVDELITFVITLMTAGHEPSAHALGNSIAELLTHPDQLARLKQDPELWQTAVDELVRRCGPTQVSVPRYAAVDVELGGVLIRAGDVVQPMLTAANYDPRRYADPDRFDVGRRMKAPGHGHLGFGHGPHYCLGAYLAKLQLGTALPALFGRFPGLALAVDPADLPWQKLPGLRRLAELPVVLAPADR
ncbi:cytochrome P450 [Streptomyces sp. ISL-22]|uniref:cytochrome P450 family protein n=1 Tax=unclassified Streptomyces TaxID=2593676 RepID=UPI001BECBC4B|nr:MULTISPECIES: cytochrome P450 [unclassified Streptomyces]MBT2418903.1 cytochrome P450 [Streptomyces sp. ISL-24]MBT2435664.1 cytochrome P450 [Streptomyces sp. ISL-22]